MGYRVAWMTHNGVLTRHSEAFMHLVDREVKEGPLSVLVSQPGDGCVEVWRAALPEGSTVLGIDRDSALADHVDGILVGDVGSRRWLLGVLGSRWFDVIHHRGTPSLVEFIWPYLKPGGVLIMEGVDPSEAVDLVRCFLAEDEFLPPEEILRVTTYFGSVVVEKRNPRVIPFLDAFSGSLDPLKVGEKWAADGAMRVDKPVA